MVIIGEHVARWTMEKVGAFTEGMKAIGWEKDGVLIAGTSFENWNRSEEHTSELQSH